MEKIKIVRDTNADLMNHVLDLVKKSGNYEKAGKIMDYYLPESSCVKELTNYEFDFLAVANFGGSEGIYVDCWLQGSFEENHRNERQTISCGTFKTLRDDLESMKVMGELAGSLTYYESQYVNSEIGRYTPFKERLYEEYRRTIRQDKKEEGSIQIKTYETNAVCPRCGAALHTSGVYNYTFVCPDCDENFYSSEVKLPKPGTVMMKVPWKGLLKTEAFTEAFQMICNKNHCKGLLLSAGVFGICWDHVPDAEEIRNIVIGLDIYMENYRG